VAGYEQAAGDFLRRLIPFPGTDVLTPLSPLSMGGLSGAGQSNPVTTGADAVTEQAASIVRRQHPSSMTRWRKVSSRRGEQTPRVRTAN